MTYKDISYGEERRQAQYPLDSQDMMEEQSQFNQSEEDSLPCQMQQVHRDQSLADESRLFKEHQDMLKHYNLFFEEQFVNDNHGRHQNLNECDNNLDLKLKPLRQKQSTSEEVENLLQFAANSLFSITWRYDRRFKYQNQTWNELIKLEGEYYELATTHPEKISQIEQSVRTNRLTEAQVEQKRRGKRYQYSHRKNLVLKILNSYHRHRFKDIPKQVITRIYWILDDEKVSVNSLKAWMRKVNRQ